MKKYSVIALLLVFALCLTMGMTGCQKDEAKTNENAAPVEELTLELAANNTVNALCSDECPVSVLENMDEKKVITIALDQEEGQLENVLNLDLPNKSFYDELSLTIDGQTVDANVYCDGKALAVTAPALLGSDQALGINFETLITDLENSTLMDALDASEVGMILNSLEEYQGMLEGMTATANELAEKFVKDLTTLLEDKVPTKSEGSVTVYDETVEAVNFTYVIEKDLIKQALDVYMDYCADYIEQMYAPMVESGVITNEDLEFMTSDIEDVTAELDAAFEKMDMECTVTVAVNPENRCIMRIDYDVSVTYEEETVDGTVAFILGKNPAESNLYTMNMNLNAPDDSALILNATLSSTTEGAVDTTTLNFDADVDGEAIKAILTCTYNNDSKEYKLAAEAEGETYAVTGKLENTDDKFFLSIDKLEAPDEALELGLAITIENDPDCQIPAVPAYTNVLTDMDLGALLGASEEYEEYPDYEEWEDYEDLEDWEDTENWDDAA